jgi:hypothetical protein
MKADYLKKIGIGLIIFQVFGYLGGVSNPITSYNYLKVKRENFKYFFVDLVNSNIFLFVAIILLVIYFRKIKLRSK